jgi:D-aminoacyl-tRNA deacylase
MKIVIQRVNLAGVSVANHQIGAIGVGLVVLVGFAKGDSEDILKKMAEKIVNLRIFPNSKGKFDLSLLDIKGDLLIIPQFTLISELKGQNRPFFGQAEKPEKANQYFDEFCKMFSSLGVTKVEKGEFGAYMKVSLVNDGPVSILIENKDL